jgi:hypothetical protein
MPILYLSRYFKKSELESITPTQNVGLIYNCLRQGNFIGFSEFVHFYQEWGLREDHGLESPNKHLVH